MKTFNELKAIGQFISQYATQLLGSGVHTSRVVRNSKRIGESLDTDVRIHTFQRTMTLTVSAIDSELVYTEVVEIPALPINFEWNSELSSLSWLAYDNRLPLDMLQEKFRQIINKQKMSPGYVLLLVGFANAAFCKLFGGDWWAMAIVFLSTLVGFYAKQLLQRKGVNHLLVFAVASFLASLCASSALMCSATASVAIATSVLFLIPGVPLINGAIDIAEGFTLIGISRIVNAMLLIIALSSGMYVTLLMVKNSLL